MVFLACALIVIVFLKRGSLNNEYLTALSRFVSTITIFAPVYILILLVLLRSAGFEESIYSDTDFNFSLFK
jgi:ABC-type dipeptide/oligopeptide/nickel transport system permease component